LGKAMSSALYKKAVFPNPVPRPVFSILLKMRKTSLTVVPFGSRSMTSPANPVKGNWREVFSGMRQVVKVESQAAMVAAAAGTDSSIRPIRNMAMRVMRKGMPGSLSLCDYPKIKRTTGRSQEEDTRRRMAAANAPGSGSLPHI
jgi:hypothetical protein